MDQNPYNLMDQSHLPLNKINQDLLDMLKGSQNVKIPYKRYMECYTYINFLIVFDWYSRFFSILKGIFRKKSILKGIFRKKSILKGI